MGSFGTVDPKGRNVDLNLVPMIDLMSCMTAFLLVTAAWTEMRAVDTGGKDKGDVQVKGQDKPTLAVMVESTGFRLGDGDLLDRRALVAALTKQAPEDPQVQVAAEDGVQYQQLIVALDAARDAGIVRVDVVDPRRFR
jgi:biopolymer transport protein ExbD